MRATLAPSILSADFGRLAEEIVEAETAGADWIHVDVMDGHFVPNLTIGPAVVAAARRTTKLPLDVHLMIEEPERYLEAFVDAGADRLTVHRETCPHLHRTLSRIRELGALPGAAVNPATPVESLGEVIPQLDLFLVMTVNPGFGGQSFIPATLGKISRARSLLDSAGREGAELQVDGGIDAATAPRAVRAGATVLVAGSSIFGDDRGIGPAVEGLREAVAAA